MIKLLFVYKDGTEREAVLDMLTDKYLLDISFNQDNRKCLIYNKDLSNIVLRPCFYDKSDIDRIDIYEDSNKILSIAVTNILYKISNLSPSSKPYEFMEVDVIDVFNN